MRGTVIGCPIPVVGCSLVIYGVHLIVLRELYASTAMGLTGRFWGESESGMCSELVIVRPDARQGRVGIQELAGAEGLGA